MARVIGEVRPRYVYVENSPLLVSRGLARVIGDLAAMGFNARWGIIGAHHVGAPHKRDRIWILAYSNSLRELQQERTKRKERRRTSYGGSSLSEYGIIPMCDTHRAGLEKRKSQPSNDGTEQSAAIGTDWWKSEPDVGRVAHGIPSRVDRLKAIGNGQVPSVAATAFRILSEL
jgi:DNA (cytosine-5)-methyltransferase 1